MFLWRKAYTRARGGSRLIQVFYHLHKRLLMYGTTKNLLGERGTINKHELLKNKSCLLMPDSKFKAFWNIIIITLLLYTALFVPFKISFITIESLGLVIFEWVVDIIFGIDILVNFLSATED